MGHEQVSFRRLIAGTWEDFDMRLMSISALYVLWGSLTNSESLATQYCKAKELDRLLDKRRRLPEEDEEKLADIHSLAESAIRYRDWARTREGQPILQDTLVAYCSAFESALKAIARALRLLVESDERTEFALIPDAKVKAISRAVSDQWKQFSKSSGDDSTARVFFEIEILEPSARRPSFVFADPTSEQAEPYALSPKQMWTDVHSAYQLRNLILHSNGRLNAEQIQLGKEVFPFRQEMHLTTVTLKAVEAAFRGILEPINPEPEQL
jgi:hypothetical protein